MKHTPFQVSHYTHPISDHIIVSQSKSKMRTVQHTEIALLS